MSPSYLLKRDNCEDGDSCGRGIRPPAFAAFVVIIVVFIVFTSCCFVRRRRHVQNAGQLIEPGRTHTGPFGSNLSPGHPQQTSPPVYSEPAPPYDPNKTPAPPVQYPPPSYSPP